MSACVGMCVFLHMSPFTCVCLCVRVLFVWYPRLVTVLLFRFLEVFMMRVQTLISALSLLFYVALFYFYLMIYLLISFIVMHTPTPSVRLCSRAVRYRAVPRSLPPPPILPLALQMRGFLRSLCQAALSKRRKKKQQTTSLGLADASAHHVHNLLQDFFKKSVFPFYNYNLCVNT